MVSSPAACIDRCEICRPMRAAASGNQRVVPCGSDLTGGMAATRSERRTTPGGRFQPVGLSALVHRRRYSPWATEAPMHRGAGPLRRCVRMPAARSQGHALGRLRSVHPDPQQLAHASIESYGEVATPSGMLRDNLAVGEPAGACFKQAECRGDGLAILESQPRSPPTGCGTSDWAGLSCSKADFSVQRLRP